MSGQSVNLTTLFLGRLSPPMRLTSTSCTYFCQQLTTTLLESVEGKTKVCAQTGYRTQDPRTYESGAVPTVFLVWSSLFFLNVLGGHTMLINKDQHCYFCFIYRLDRPYPFLYSSGSDACVRSCVSDTVGQRNNNLWPASNIG